MITTWEEHNFKKLCKENYSIMSVLIKLELVPSGANYKKFKQMINRYQIDISHFTGKLWNKGKKIGFNPIIPLESILIQDSNYLNTSLLKKRLIRANILKYECFICKLDKWLNKPISLQLDHINGINNDNRLENLRLLCPNCHSQTPTFAGKNIQIKMKTIKNKKIKTVFLKPKFDFCCDCKNPTNNRIRCRKCSRLLVPSKIEWPIKEVLEKMVWEKPSSLVAKELGVSDVAISKRCKKLEIKKPERGYWEKIHHNKS